MPVLSDIFSKKRDYRQCIMADIGRHYESIKHWVPEGEKNEFQERMADCIEEDTAWCFNDAFLYYSKLNMRMTHGVAIFGSNNPLDLLSLFIGVFSYEDKEVCMMRFKLHSGKVLEEYKSLLTVESMKRNHRDSNHPLMIRIDDFRKKFLDMLVLNDVH